MGGVNFVPVKEGMEWIHNPRGKEATMVVGRLVPTIILNAVISYTWLVIMLKKDWMSRIRALAFSGLRWLQWCTLSTSTQVDISLSALVSLHGWNISRIWRT